MKDYALWLNRHKVLHASEIAENLDIASLRGYFAAGSLLDWLCGHGGKEYAEKLSRISPDDGRLDEKLAEIFGGVPLPVKRFGSGEPSETLTSAASSFNIPVGSFSLPDSFAGYGSGGFIGYGSGGSYAFLTSFGAFSELYESIFGKGSFSFSSAGFGSFRFWEWEWEWLYRLYSGELGSFALTSFTSGGALIWELLSRMFSGGAFGSRAFGSFLSLGSFFGFMNFGSFTGFGSFSPENPPDLPVMDEYDLIMLETLIKCPLNGFGYGIHNI